MPPSRIVAPPSVGAGAAPSAETPPPSVAGAPASVGGGVRFPQMPREEPGGRRHSSPAQQSAVVVHAPPVCTQMAPHTKAGPLSAFVGTHASPQQSALLAQGWPWREPASVQPWPSTVHRGIPKISCWHTAAFWFTFPAQQLFSALQEEVASLHTAPAARHACPLSQRPKVSVGDDFAQTTLPLPPG
jgi:hypothetical protein